VNGWVHSLSPKGAGQELWLTRYNVGSGAGCSVSLDVTGFTSGVAVLESGCMALKRIREVHLSVLGKEVAQSKPTRE